MIKGKKKGLFPKQTESKSYQLHHSPFIIGISPKLRERISKHYTMNLKNDFKIVLLLYNIYK